MTELTEVVTDRPINPSQLGHANPGVPLRIVGPYEDGTYKVKSEDVTEKQLQAIIDSHVADPDWTPPPKPLTPEETAKKVKQDALKTKLKLTSEEFATLKEMLL